MEVLLNELSLHGQFTCVEDFKKAIHNIMTIKKLKSELYCHRNLRNDTVLVTRDLSLQQAIKQFDLNLQRAFMSWLTTKGPFWEDSRQHDADHWLESQNEVVTDTGLGEVAYRCFKGANFQTFSFEFSRWQINPIAVNWHRDNNKIESINVINHWAINTLLDDLLNDFQPDESILPSLVKPFPNLELSNRLVDLSEFREELANYPSDKQAIIQPIADRIAKMNGYKINLPLSSFNQERSKSYRKIYESVGNGKNKIYLSVDFEKGAFELCNQTGEHQGEYKFNGEKSGAAKSDHSIILK